MKKAMFTQGAINILETYNFTNMELRWENPNTYVIKVIIFSFISLNLCVECMFLKTDRPC